jgi:hypothetical protein
MNIRATRVYKIAHRAFGKIITALLLQPLGFHSLQPTQLAGPRLCRKPEVTGTATTVNTYQSVTKVIFLYRKKYLL